MKKILFTLVISLLMTNNVFAQTHDVTAKYEKSYNVDLESVTLNNNTKTLTIDNYTFKLSTTQKNIDVVIIKAETEGNNYIKKVTNNTNNYYMVIYKDNRKISNGNLTIELETTGKTLHIYDNQNNKMTQTNNKVNLKNNDYYIDITNSLADIRNDYKIINVDTLVNDIEDLIDNGHAEVQVYNSKNQLLDNTKKLGTGYKIVLNNNNIITEHQIVVKGDTTGDANINLNDVTRLYHYYKAIEPMDDAYRLAGDVATNNVVNLNDITKIYHYYTNIIEEL